MAALLSKVRWGRVLFAGVAVQFAVHVTLVVLVFAATDPTFGFPEAVPDALLARLGAWSVLVLTPLLAAAGAAWVARTVEAGVASLHGLMVGLVVAAVGLGIFWPPGSAPLAALATTVGAGWLAGRRGKGPGSYRREEVA